MVEPPQYFTVVDLDDWLIDVTRALKWQHIKEQWKDKIINKCCSEANIQKLEIQNVYYHLGIAIPLLQERHKRQLSAEDFLNTLY
jgi:hypothetical protein